MIVKEAAVEVWLILAIVTSTTKGCHFGELLENGYDL